VAKPQKKIKRQKLKAVRQLNTLPKPRNRRWQDNRPSGQHYIQHAWATNALLQLGVLRLLTNPDSAVPQFLRRLAQFAHMPS
jgi:hypothetical protein